MVTLAESHNPLAKRNLPKLPTWELTDERPRSISGVELQGDQILRNIYLDETGITSQEPIVLVAGVIVNDDAQYLAVEKAIRALTKEYIPLKLRKVFRGFHAKEIYHGTGKVFGRDDYPRERGHEALCRVLAIPREHKIPVAYGYLTKSLARPRANTSPREKVDWYHSLAYAHCVIAAETFIRESGSRGELARVIAEDNNTTRDFIKTAHGYLKGREPAILRSLRKSGLRKDLPLKRIVEVPFFALKEDVGMLQLADVCAFVLRYWAEGKRNEITKDYFDSFWGTDCAYWLAKKPAPTMRDVLTFQIACDWEEALRSLKKREKPRRKPRSRSKC